MKKTVYRWKCNIDQYFFESKTKTIFQQHAFLHNAPLYFCEQIHLNKKIPTFQSLEKFRVHVTKEHPICMKCGMRLKLNEKAAFVLKSAKIILKHSNFLRNLHKKRSM